MCKAVVKKMARIPWMWELAKARVQEKSMWHLQSYNYNIQISGGGA